MKRKNKFKIIISFLLVFSFCAIYSKMSLYTFYTTTHKELFYEWFLCTLQDDFELQVEQYPQECPTSLFLKEGWGKTMLRKVNLILKAIEENWGSVFIYADVDIQFFKPIEKLIIQAIEHKDIVFQRNNPRGHVCAGFFACRGNERTKILWENVRKRMIETNHASDQNLLNEIIRSEEYQIAWDFLPVTFFGGGTLTGRSWKPGSFLKLPDNPNDLVLHHANYTSGVENKIEQFLYVRRIINDWR